MLPVSTDRKLVFPQKTVGGELIPEHGILVDVEHIPPLVLAGNRPDLPSAPAVGVQLLKLVVAGRIRGLPLA